MKLGNQIHATWNSYLYVKRLIIFCIILLASVCSAQEINKDDGKQDATFEHNILKAIIVGMNREEVIAKKGKPSFETKNDDGTSIMYYIQSIPLHPTPQNYGYGGFQVSLKGDKVTQVNIIHRTILPTEKE